MSRKFRIDRDCYDTGAPLFKTRAMTFHPGITILLGCNGCGKTTLMRQMKSQVEHRFKLPFVEYDNYAAGGHQSVQTAAFYGNMDFVINSFLSSEGEGIVLNLQQIASKMGAMFKKYPDAKEYWVFLDGIDSGLSLDAIQDLKHGLFDTVYEHYPDKDIYIIISANSFELTKHGMCFNTIKGKYMNVKSYDRYTKLVLQTREYKDERDKLAAETAKDRETEEAVECDADEDVWNKRKKR